MVQRHLLILQRHLPQHRFELILLFPLILLQRQLLMMWQPQALAVPVAEPLLGWWWCSPALRDSLRMPLDQHPSAGHRPSG